MFPTRTAGGAAASGGFTFQHRVTAWIAVRILAERDASLPWELPATAVLTYLRCETGEEVDDLLVGTNDNRAIFVQCKRALDLSQAQTSDLASVIDQFVRQTLRARATGLPLPWRRPLDAQDRLIVAIAPEATSIPVRVHLAAVLQRLRTLSSSQPITDAAVNEEEERALSVVTEHVTRSWRHHAGAVPEGDVRWLLSLMHVFPLEIDPDRPAEIQALDTLRQSVLRQPEQATAAWHALLTACAEFTRARSSATRSGLVNILLRVPCHLKAAPSFRGDIERLQRHTDATVRDLADSARMRFGAIDVKMHRASTAALAYAVEAESLVVVGDAGAGKSAALHDLVANLREDGRDVVLLAAGRIEATSLGALRMELGLEHEVLDVLQEWPGPTPGVLVIDALDAARAESAAVMLRDLIRRTVEDDGRWHVVASIRKFDLRYSPQLQREFAGRPSTTFTDREFASVRHLNVPLLADDELNQVESQSPALYALVQEADGDLRRLLRVPFNLRLVAELIAQGVLREELTPIRTQCELLEKYWFHRVIRSDGFGGAREAVLRRICEQMVGRRKMTIGRATVEDAPAAPHLTTLLSCQLLAEWQPSATTRADRYVLTFSHHVLFDYAVARTMLAGPIEDLMARLASEPDLILFIRPSLVHHLQSVWESNARRSRFWEALFELGKASAVPEVAKIVGPSVVAASARDLADFAVLYEALASPHAERRRVAEETLRRVVEAVLEDAETSSLAARADLWCQLLERVTR